MHLSTKSRLLFVFKLVGAAIFLFAGLTRQTQDVGYRFADVPQENFLLQSGSSYLTVPTNSGDALVQDVIESIYPDAHNASDQNTGNIFAQKFTSVCAEHPDLCAKVSFVGEISDKDKYVYFSLLVYLSDAIDSFLSEQFSSLDDVLKSLTINTHGGLRRGGADWHDITINTEIIQSYEEFFEVLTHEVGHIVDLGMIQGASRSKNLDYTEFGAVKFAADDWSIDFYALSWKDEFKRYALSSASDFCSGYGMSNPFEDFAECFNLYLNHNTLFRTWAKDNDALAKKYNLFAALFGNSYLFAGDDDLISLDLSDTGWRPWDTTRIK